MKMEKRDAVIGMVESFNAMPLGVFERAFIGENYEYWDEMTILNKPCVGDYAVYPSSGFIESIEDGTAKIDGDDELYDLSEIELETPPYPSWGTVWQVDDFNGRMGEDFIQKLSEIGFIIFDTDYGVIIGIDGGGYDFYEAHWTPLYDLLGYKWHI